LFDVRLICDCEEKHYYDEDEFKCIPCPDEKALYCTANGVTTCVGGYTVEDGRCVECDGAEGVASWNTCTYSGCNSCAISACKEGYCHNNHRVTTSNSSYLTDYCEKIPTGNGICDGKNGVVCDNGYHYNGEDCVVCPDANATSCDSEGKSTVCKSSDYFLESGRCCLSGSMVDTENNMCISCTDTTTLGACHCPATQYADGAGGCCPQNSSVQVRDGYQIPKTSCYCLPGYTFNSDFSACEPCASSVCETNEGMPCEDYIGNSDCGGVNSGYYCHSYSTDCSTGGIGRCEKAPAVKQYNFAGQWPTIHADYNTMNWFSAQA
jgi:hypothetical protein